jgi:hypothetical protein
VQRHLPQQEIQKIGLSAQTPSSTDNNMLKAATAVQETMTELSEAVSKKRMVIMKTV